MRWEALQLDQGRGQAAAPAIPGRDAVARTFDTPEVRTAARLPSR